MSIIQRPLWNVSLQIPEKALRSCRCGDSREFGIARVCVSIYFVLSHLPHVVLVLVRRILRLVSHGGDSAFPRPAMMRGAEF